MVLEKLFLVSRISLKHHCCFPMGPNFVSVPDTYFRPKKYLYLDGGIGPLLKTPNDLKWFSGKSF